MPVWSCTSIGVKKLETFFEKKDDLKKECLEKIFVNVREAAYQIIERKGATYYGIGMALVRITKAILNNENCILTVSAYLSGEYEQNDVYIGVPAVINRNGIHEVIEIDLNEQEKEQFNHSVSDLKKNNEA